VYVLILQFDDLFQITVLYDFSWLFTDDRRETRHIGPDVINGCDASDTRQADDAHEL